MKRQKQNCHENSTWSEMGRQNVQAIKRSTARDLMYKKYNYFATRYSRHFFHTQSPTSVQTGHLYVLKKRWKIWSERSCFSWKINYKEKMHGDLLSWWWRMTFLNFSNYEIVLSALRPGHLFKKSMVSWMSSRTCKLEHFVTVFHTMSVSYTHLTLPTICSV